MKIKNYSSSLKSFIIFAFLFFLTSVLAGYFTAQAYPAETIKKIEEFKEAFKPILEATPFFQFILIFLNNSFSLFLTIILGIVAGIFPIIVLFSNGTMLGIFAFFWTEEMTFISFLAGIMPHGFIEITLLIVGSAIGLRIGYLVIKKILAKFIHGERSSQIENSQPLKPLLVNYLWFFVKIALPLLLLAAAIEVFITPFFIDFFQ